MSARWAHRFNVSDIFHHGLEVSDLAKLVASRMRAARFYDASDPDWSRIARRIARAKTVDQFDAAWSDFYDLADHERIWVVTR